MGLPVLTTVPAMPSPTLRVIRSKGSSFPPLQGERQLIGPVFELVNRAGLGAHKFLRPLHSVVEHLLDVEGGVDQGAGAKNGRSSRDKGASRVLLCGLILP